MLRSQLRHQNVGEVGVDSQSNQVTDADSQTSESNGSRGKAVLLLRFSVVELS